MNNEKPKTLEDLVPPLELCKAAREVIGDRTALVWEVYHYQYSVDPYVMSRETSETARGSAVESVYPAPTLAEVFSLLKEHSWEIKHGVGGEVVGMSIGTDDGVISDWAKTGENTATLALRLLMKVKGVEQ